MRRTSFIYRGLLATILSFFLAAAGHSQHRLVLLHPTVSNIENIVSMIDNKVIDLRAVELIGVYSANEVYDYSQSENYLKEHHLNFYKLRKVSGVIKPDEIYRQNSCTSPFRELFEESDAILFFGGPDIPAAVYGEKQNQLTLVTDPNRHYFETSFFFHLIGGSRNPSFIPFLTDHPDFIVRGFCLGMQTMNVAAGGTLLQDIPSECYHKNTLEEVADLPVNNQHRSSVSPMYPLVDLFDGIFHQIKMETNGYLKEISEQSATQFPTVLSAHHQAVGRIGAKLNLIATSMDGKIVEGLQHATFKNVVGVQFHPEPASLYKPEILYTTIPGEAFSPYDLLKKTNSLNFHQLFWKDFSLKVENSSRLKKEFSK